MSRDALSLHNVSFRYVDGDRAALDDVTLTLPSGSWTLLTGPSGSGKSTLLRLLKPETLPKGQVSGSVAFAAGEAHKTGLVMQSPSDQMVMDTVRYELAFGLENEGLSSGVIERRIAEAARFFGLEPLIDKRVTELSGGEKQLVNVASTMIMRPDILLLDEPTAQLDPIAVEQFLTLMERLRRELGTTILMAEHRLDDVLARADHVVHLVEGRVAFCGAPDAFCAHLFAASDPFARAVPPTPTLFHHLKVTPLPLSVAQGRAVIDALPHTVQASPPARPRRVPLLQAKELTFRYRSEGPDVLTDLSYVLPDGGAHAIVGGNGSGKSTLLRLLVGALKPSHGSVRTSRAVRLGLLPQDPRLVLSQETLLADLMEWAPARHYDEANARDMAHRLGLLSLLDRHPYDLSGGEQQRAALAKLLLLKPDVLLLDEPAKSLDSVTKMELIRHFRTLLDQGKTILLATHDLEFAAALAETTAMLFDRRVVSSETTSTFLRENAFYTTDLCRLLRGHDWPWTTVDEALSDLKGARDEAQA